MQINYDFVNIELFKIVTIVIIKRLRNFKLAIWLIYK
jgi:hypothetical protein